LSTVAAEPDLVAGVAADAVAVRKPGIEVERLAQLDQSGSGGDAFDRRRLLRDRLKNQLRFLHQSVFGRCSGDPRHRQSHRRNKSNPLHCFSPIDYLFPRSDRRPLQLIMIHESISGCSC
jgi:hypothetical protein